MKFKIKKDIFLKKSTWLVLGIFAITLVNIPRFNIKADTPEGKLKFEPDTLKVLEVLSGNQSLLSNKKVDFETKGEDNIGGQKVEITYVNMPKYISMVDDIEGEYDVVAITNKKGDDMSDNFDVNKIYRSFTSPFSQEIGRAKYGNNCNYTHGNKEYFPENDITNKRAQLIVDMINNGRLVYVDKSATEVAGTKLNQIFNGQGIGVGITDKANFKNIPASQITLNKIVEDYKKLPQENKRVKVMTATKPIDEEYKNGNPTNQRMMNFSINANAESKEKLTFKVYLDFNGDGLYTGDPYRTFTFDGTDGYRDYDFNVPINNGFIGYLGWKVDIERSSGVKTSVSSFTKFCAQNGKKKINVLQIYPNSDDCHYYNNLDNKDGSGKTRLKQSSKFMGLLAGLADYDVNIEDISASEFSEQYGASKGKKHLNDQYDMVIIGFADSYNDADITSDDAIADIGNFIAANKSMMVTHDVVGLGIYDESSGCTKLAQFLKDKVGQSRYPDEFNGNKMVTDNISTTKYDDNTASKDKIPHDNNNGIKTLGQTARAIFGQDAYKSGKNAWEATQTTKVKNVNNAQITSYPFDLALEATSKDGTIPVSLTHTQWYQLNLEDPEVVPWYNLANSGKDYSKMDVGDSRNYYYTYNKGNITVSGTGHSGVPTDTEELKLFVNTIIKAVRGSNSAPTVSCYSDADTTNQLKDVEGHPELNPVIMPEDGYTFYTVPVDPDGDMLNVEIKALGQIVKTEKNYSSNEPIKAELTPELLKDVKKGDSIPVEVTVTDPLGEKGTTTFTVVCDGNQAPNIDNSTISGKAISDKETVGSSRTSDYAFTTIPTDPDEEDQNDLTVSIKVDGQAVAKVTDSDNQDVTTDTKVVSGQKLKVVIPKDAFKGKQTGDKVNVETTVNDPRGKSATKTFTIEIGKEDPAVLMSVVDSISENGDLIPVDNSKKFANLDNVKIGGKISSVYDKKGIVSIKVPNEEVVKGSPTISRVVADKLDESKYDMIADYKDEQLGYTTYIFDLNSADGTKLLNLGDVEEDGMTFIVEYDAMIDDTEKVEAAKENAVITSGQTTTTIYKGDDGYRYKTSTTPIYYDWEYSANYINYLTFGSLEKSATTGMYNSPDVEKNNMSLGISTSTTVYMLTTRNAEGKDPQPPVRLDNPYYVDLF